MKIKRFFAKDMRTALAEVKETLGPDAVIMSNKKVTGGVEIVAAVDYQSQVPGPKDAPVRRQLNDESVNISSAARQMIRPSRRRRRSRTNIMPIPWPPCWRASRSSSRATGRQWAIPNRPGWPLPMQRPEHWPSRGSGAQLPNLPSPKPGLRPASAPSTCPAGSGDGRDAQGDGQHP